MTTLTREQIVAGLKELGIPKGAILLVHSSLSSLGVVQGGADTVIDALLDVLGPEGTLLMPTHPARDGRTFDAGTIPSDMGIISENFRRRAGVLRSRHPYHPVAACGPRAEEMLRHHELSAVPDGPNTPYGRLITRGGWVLHIGCDLDTLTLLHTVEAELDLPYLRELDMDYVDARGVVQTLHIERCPGGHRGGVLKFDRLFRDEGAMAVSRIGRAVCRLLSATEAAAIMRREMAGDPFFALDDNPHCADCVRFRSRIKAARLAEEDFRLSAPLWAVAEDLSAASALARAEGISWVELEAAHMDGSDAAADALRDRLADDGLRVAVLRMDWGSPDGLARSCATAARLRAQHLLVGAPPRSTLERGALIAGLQELARQAGEQELSLLLGNRQGSFAESLQELGALVADVGSPHLAASYDPAAIAGGGGSPFYGGLYKGGPRRFVRHVELRDVVASTGKATPLGSGNSEIREIVSNLRSRSYEGFLCLWPLSPADVGAGLVPAQNVGPGPAPDGFRAAARSFWELLDSI